MQAPTSLRLFFAIDLPPTVRASIADWRQRQRFRGRAEPAANLHMTLVFLGDVVPADMDRVARIADGVTFDPLNMTLDRVRRWRNGILHLAPSAPPAGLLALQAALADGIQKAGLGSGFQVDHRRFSPHLTLGRDVPEMNRNRLPRCPPFAWTADTLTLFSSERGGTPHYRVVAEWPARTGPTDPDDISATNGV